MDKVCFRCGLPKPVEAFYRHPKMGDGRLGKCKDCTKADVRTNYRFKKERYREYEQVRSKRPSRKLMALEYQRRRRSRHPDRYKANSAVGNAIRDGRLHRKPCEVCGAAKAEAHHADYSRPLDVRWLCLPHHRSHGHGIV